MGAVEDIHFVNVFLQPLVRAVLFQVVCELLLLQKQFVKLVAEELLPSVLGFLFGGRWVIIFGKKIIGDILGQVVII